MPKDDEGFTMRGVAHQRTMGVNVRLSMVLELELEWELGGCVVRGIKLWSRGRCRNA